MDRRQFLEIGGTSVLAFPLAGSIALIVPPREQQRLMRPDMLTRVGDDGLTRRLGRQYRRAFPKENRSIVLKNILRRSAAREDGSDLSSQLQSRIERDFAEGHTVVLDGWILARTEARQCALVSLLKF